MLRVAGYCRVSTDQTDQANSFENQQRYFRQYIEHQPEWQLYRIYADEGISGTVTKKRAQFNQMMEDARAGRFQLLLTKEVSRFSRNILDTIACTRELRALGVVVIFMTDGISTADPDSELRLSIMASLAQEESRRTSERVVWGQTRQMEKGVVFGPSLLGYCVTQGSIFVEPEGAEIVQLIFQKYALEQRSASEIAELLTQWGYRTHRGHTNWNAGAIHRILKNEKYVGDLVQKKTYTPDYLTHEKKKNTGQVPLVCIKNHHEPIISREVWNLAQERLRRNDRKNPAVKGHSDRYIFSGKIRCGECGTVFVSRFKYGKNGAKYRYWSCKTAIRWGSAGCRVGKLVRDDDAVRMLKTAWNCLNMDRNRIAACVTEIAMEAIESEGYGYWDDPERLEYEIRRIQKKREMMVDRYLSGDICEADKISLEKKYETQIGQLRHRMEQIALDRNASGRERISHETVRRRALSVLNGSMDSEVFFKLMVHSLVVYQDRHMELRLNDLPQVFCFIG